MVRIGLIVFLAVALQTGNWFVISAQTSGQSDYGPEIKSFLEFMRHEDDELEFQIRRNEISRRSYIRAKTRIAIHRETVLNLAKETGRDEVPELHIVTAAEIDQLIEDGNAAIKDLKRGDVVAERWRYLGSVRRGETFYIFERMTVR